MIIFSNQHLKSIKNNGTIVTYAFSPIIQRDHTDNEPPACIRGGLFIAVFGMHQTVSASGLSVDYHTLNINNY